MTLTNQEISALLEVFNYAGDLDELSELIGYNAYELQSKLLSEMMSQTSYDLDCY